MKKDKKVDAQLVSFSKKQFLALLKVVYLGNWMANANRAVNMKKEYESIEDYIFSLAPKFGFERYMDHEDTDGDKYYPTSYFEEETDVDKLHEEYDEDTFWDELAEHLGERDFLEKYSIEEIKKMSGEEYFEKISKCVDYYSEEFNEHGLDHLEISILKKKMTQNRDMS